MTSPTRRRQVVKRVQEVFSLSERRVCRATERPRFSQRYMLQIPDKDEPLTQRAGPRSITE